MIRQEFIELHVNLSVATTEVLEQAQRLTL